MEETVEILTGEAGVAETARRLLAGECVALPTETVYGLAADASNDGAVESVFKAKGRPADHPLIVHVASALQLGQWAKSVPDVAMELADTFWPGPLTLLLEKADHVSGVVTGGLPTIALRVPAHPLFKEVLEKTGLGLAAPSANPYKKLSPTTAELVVKGMKGRIDAVLDGGPCEFGLESTIVDLTSEHVTVLRAGPINRDMIEKKLGRTVVAPTSHQVSVPGNVESHYQPGVPTSLATLAEIRSCEVSDAGFLIWSDESKDAINQANKINPQVIKLANDPVEYGRQLYSTLSKLEDLGAAEIYVETPPEGEAWRAINDRLNRATGPRTSLPD